MSESQVRFLARGSALLIALLALWWLALRSPMLFLLELAESVALGILPNAGSTPPIAVDPSGDWNFRIPVEDTARETFEQSGPARFSSVEFTTPRPDVVLFTFSLPVYWAIVLAVPLGRSSLRALLWGTALVFLLEVVALLVQVQIMAYTALAQLHLTAPGLAAWWREFGNRLLVGVIPFAMPVLIAVVLHRDLRSQIFAVPKVMLSTNPKFGNPA